MTVPVPYDVPIRECVSRSRKESVVFAVDVLSQPKYRETLLQLDPDVRSRCSRALPLARNEDIVVLSAPTDTEYYQWLRDHEMGPERVVVYDLSESSVSLSEAITAEPDKLKKAIVETGKAPVYLPFYCGESDVSAAKVLDAELFGCDESIVLEYFDKTKFKEVVRDIGIETMAGASYTLSERDKVDGRDLEKIVSKLLGSYPSLVIRGSLGAAGSSIYQVQRESVQEVIEQIRAQNDPGLLLEPLLKVIASPNDQWIIDRTGRIFHLGISVQLFKEFRHIGNLRGNFLSQRIERKVIDTSAMIVQRMAEHGYRGVLGIDYIVSDQGVYPIENNARLNGSSFAFGIIDHLKNSIGPVPCWKFYKAVTAPCSFMELCERIAPVLYDGQGINTVFPFDCDSLSRSGIFTPLLIAEDSFHIQYLEETLNGLGIERI